MLADLSIFAIVDRMCLQIHVQNGCTTSYQCIFLGMDSGIRGDFADTHGTGGSRLAYRSCCHCAGDDFGDIFMTGNGEKDFFMDLSDQATTQAQW